MDAIFSAIRAFATSDITQWHFLTLSSLLFVIGVFGILTRRNLIAILMSVEILLNAAMLNFVTFAAYSADTNGHIFALFIVAVAAAEVAVGLAIFINVFRSKGGVRPDDLTEMSS